jgi:hypothetical protein
MDAVFNHALPEVDDHPQFERRSSKVSQDLSFKDAVVGHDSFAFDDDLTTCNHIDAKRRTKCVAFIKDRKLYLALDRKAPLFQLPNQGPFIDVFLVEPRHRLVMGISDYFRFFCL